MAGFDGGRITELAKRLTPTDAKQSKIMATDPRQREHTVPPHGSIIRSEAEVDGSVVRLAALGLLAAVPRVSVTGGVTMFDVAPMPPSVSVQISTYRVGSLGWQFAKRALRLEKPNWAP